MLQCILPVLHGSTLFHLCAHKGKIKVRYELGYSPIKLFLKELCSQLRTFSFSFLHLIFCNIFFILLLTFYFHLVSAFDEKLGSSTLTAQCRDLSCFQPFSSLKDLHSVVWVFLLYLCPQWRLYPY